MPRSDAHVSILRPPPLPQAKTPPNAPPLWRFFALAAAVVAIVGSVAFARRMQPPNLRIHAEATGTPSAEGPARDAAAPSQPTFTGSGTWVMSSLPACFDERSRVRGPYSALRDAIPPESERIRAASVVRVDTCTIVVGEHDLWIARGADRLHVPPEAALYRHDGRLTLVTIRGTVAEIRAYESNPKRSWIYAPKSKSAGRLQSSRIPTPARRR